MKKSILKILLPLESSAGQRIHMEAAITDIPLQPSRSSFILRAEAIGGA